MSDATDGTDGTDGTGTLTGIQEMKPLKSPGWWLFSAEKLTDRDLVNSILDVEDLVRFGNKQRFHVLLFDL